MIFSLRIRSKLKGFMMKIKAGIFGYENKFIGGKER